MSGGFRFSLNQTPRSPSAHTPLVRGAAALLLICVLAGCGEHQEARQERLYGANAYRVAGDTTAWSNEPFNGDAGAWARDIDERARNQNEYRRIR